MNQIEKCKVMTYTPVTSTTSATALTVFDTIGCKKAHIYTLSGTQTTTSQVWADITIYQHSTSSVTSGSVITEASWATAATTSAENALPAASVAGVNGCVVETHIDLAGKHRYLGILSTRGATPTANAGGSFFVLLEPDVSADSTTKKAVANLTIGTTAGAVAYCNA